MLGASLGYAANDIPAWSEALETSIGTLINLIYSTHAGNFGRFLTVLLSLSVLSNLAPTLCESHRASDVGRIFNYRARH